MQDCIFCKIIAGEIPACRLHEDEHTLAFMDIGPLVKGHALVIPKKHYDPLTEAPPEVLSACMVTVRAVMQAMHKALDCQGVNLHQANGAAAGQVVPHLHFHVIPRFADDGHHWNWNAKSYKSQEAMQSMADRIKQNLS